MWGEEEIVAAEMWYWDSTSSTVWRRGVSRWAVVVGWGGGNEDTYQGLAVEAAHACRHDTFYEGKRVAVENGVAVDAGSGRMLEP